MAGKHTYTKGYDPWRPGLDGGTAATPTKLDNFETGIFNAQDTANDAWDKAGAAQSDADDLTTALAALEARVEALENP